MDTFIDNFDIGWLLIVFLAYSAGGFVKGVASFGLPTIAIPILTFVLPLPLAIAIMVIPMFVSNLYQMRASGHFMISLKRHWPLIAAMLLALIISIPVLKSMNAELLLMIAGTTLLVITFLDWRGITLPDLHQKERYVGPVIGAVGGLIGGVTSFFGILPIFYLVALKIPKEQFISAVSLVLLSGSSVMLIGLNRLEILTPDVAIYALIGMAPLFASMKLGTMLRHRISQEVFRHLTLGLIFTMGLIMIIKGLVQSL